MWVSENLEDVKSDMSAFHRIDDITTMSASTFFPRAERLGAYDGVIAFRAKVKNAEAQHAEQSAYAPTSGRAVVNPREIQSVPADVMLAEHELSGWVERG